MLRRPREEFFTLGAACLRFPKAHMLDMFVTVFPSTDYRIETCTNMVRHVKHMHTFSFLVDAVFSPHFKALPVIGSEIVVFEESDWSFAAIQDLLSHHLIL